MENTSAKSNKVIYIVILLVVIILVTGGIAMAYNKKKYDKKKDDDRIANENRYNTERDRIQKEKDEKAKKFDYADNNVIGSYTGKSASIINPSLIFPVSSLTINTDQTFKFETSKLDLAILGNEKLKVNNIYPTMDTLVMGQYIPNSDAKTYDFKVTDLIVIFKVADKVLNNEQSAALLVGLSQAGITLPNVSSTRPAIINTTIEFNNGILAATNTKNSQITMSFNGNK